MKWYYKILGGHTHVRVLMNGGKCGDLCFRNEEFQEILNDAYHFNAIEFIDETEALNPDLKNETKQNQQTQTP